MGKVVKAQTDLGSLEALESLGVREKVVSSFSLNSLNSLITLNNLY